MITRLIITLSICALVDAKGINHKPPTTSKNSLKTLITRQSETSRFLVLNGLIFFPWRNVWIPMETTIVIHVTNHHIFLEFFFSKWLNVIFAWSASKSERIQHNNFWITVYKQLLELVFIQSFLVDRTGLKLWNKATVSYVFI